jgi:hypothetical protein
VFRFFNLLDLLRVRVILNLTVTPFPPHRFLLWLRGRITRVQLVFLFIIAMTHSPSPSLIRRTSPLTVQLIIVLIIVLVHVRILILILVLLIIVVRVVILPLLVLPDIIMLPVTANPIEIRRRGRCCIPPLALIFCGMARWGLDRVFRQGPIFPSLNRIDVHWRKGSLATFALV